MDRNTINWHGYWVAAPTPFRRDGSMDEDAWRQELRLYLEQGVHGVLVNGTTGEWFSQSVDERHRVAEIAVETVAGKIPVVIGCTTFTPGDSIALGRHARDIGADGILSTPPPYVSPTPREIERFYATISDSVDLPLMVYNWARGTGVEIEAGLAESLAAIETVVAIKDSTANIAQAIETLQRVVDRVRVFGGFVSRAGLALLQEIGGDGSIDGGGLGAPFAVRFYESFWKGDLETAREAAGAYRALMSQLIRPDWAGVFASPQSQIKAAMRLLGQPGGYPRPPLLPLEDAASLAELQQILDKAGLLREAAAAAA